MISETSAVPGLIGAGFTLLFGGAFALGWRKVRSRRGRTDLPPGEGHNAGVEFGLALIAAAMVLMGVLLLIVTLASK